MRFRTPILLLALAMGLFGCASMVIENYFAEVDSTVQPVWAATMSEALKKQGLDRVAGPVETRVDVIIDPTGKVIDVRLGRSSGLDYINAASLETFRRVGQLPAPPERMLIDGRAKLDWGFVIVE